MNKFFIFVLCTLFSCSVFASRPRERAVVVDTICGCSAERFRQVVDKFFFQFQTNSDSLFQWVYLNTEGDGNKDEGGKDAIALRYGDAKYDPVTRSGDLAIDIYVFGAKMFADRHIYTQNYGTSMNATYSGRLLDNLDIIFHVDSIGPEQIRVRYDFKLRLGQMAAALVSDKTWHGAMRWRLEQLFANLVEFAETGTVTRKQRLMVKR